MKPIVLTTRAGLSLLVLLAALALAPTSASAGILASWDLTANASSPSGLAATSVNAPATAAGLFQNGTVSGNTATFTYDTKGFVAGAEGDNVEARLAVNSLTNVTDLVFSAFASNTGPGLVDVNYEVDGGALTHLENLTIGTATGVNATNYDVNFGGLTIQNSLSVFFSADANGVSANGGTLGSGGTFRLNNVGDVAATPMAFEGVPVVAPEPSTVVLLCVGAIGMFVAARRRVAA